MHDDIRVIEGGIAVDDRGSVTFANDLAFDDIKRFYLVANHRAGMVRAWHAHRREAKYVLVTKGAAVVGAVKVDDWDSPSRDAEVFRRVLSATNPQVIYIPAGYANGFMSLTDDLQIMFFSTSTLKESQGDDVRYAARHWDIWQVEER